MAFIIEFKQELMGRQSFSLESIPEGDDIVLDPPIIGTLKAEGTFEALEDQFLVDGVVTCRLDVQCDRCLAPMVWNVEETFSEIFLKGETDPDSESYFYQGRRVSLDKMLWDVVSLNLPMRFLCKEDCKGLCPRCGADRNVTDCECDQLPPENNPFQQLSGLFEK